jgi:hypothetical protein
MLSPRKLLNTWPVLVVVLEVFLVAVPAALVAVFSVSALALFAFLPILLLIPLDFSRLSAIFGRTFVKLTRFYSFLNLVVRVFSVSLFLMYLFN